MRIFGRQSIIQSEPIEGMFMPTYDKDVLKGLRPIERHWVLQKLAGLSDSQACINCGQDPSAYAHYPNLDKCRELIDDLFEAPLDAAIARLWTASEKAADVMIKGLESKNERIAQAAARDIMDRLAGRATVRLETSSDNDRVEQYLANLKRITDVFMGTAAEGQTGIVENPQVPALDASAGIPQLVGETEVGGGWRAGREEPLIGDGDGVVDLPEPARPLLDSGA
jgi:hypothetical protein